MTVAELLHLNPSAVVAQVYDVGSEPVEKAVAKRARRRARLRPGALNPWLPDAMAGASDAQLVRATGASPAQVRHWRDSHEISQPRGRPARLVAATRLAMDLLPGAYPPVMVETKSAVGGTWEPPQYVVRMPLDYASFARAIVFLREAEWSVAQVAAALGVRERDVTLAETLDRARAA